MQGIGFMVWGFELGFFIQGLGSKVLGLGCWVQDSGFRVKGLGFWVLSLGFRV
jgi:hypothetical protein